MITRVSFPWDWISYSLFLTRRKVDKKEEGREKGRREGGKEKWRKTGREEGRREGGREAKNKRISWYEILWNLSRLARKLKIKFTV